MADEQLSTQDVQDLREIRQRMDPNDARGAKIDALLKTANPASQPGAMQTQKDGPIYNADKYAADQREGDKAAAASFQKAVGTVLPAGEASVGAAQGAMSTGRNLGGLAIRAIRSMAPETGNKLAGMWPEAVNNSPAEVMKPQSPSAKAGFAGEQAAEFLAPAGEVAKGAKAIDAGVDAAKLAPLASRALKLGGRAGLEGAAGATVGAAQGQDPKIAGLASAATPVAAAALKPVGAALADAAPSLARKLLRPVPTQIEKAERFGREVGKGVADEGIVATSLPDLTQKIAAKKEEVGKTIGDTLKAASKPGQTINVQPHIDKPIDEMIQKVLNGEVEGGQGLIDRLNELKASQQNIRQIGKDGRLEIASPKNLALTPEETHKLKRQIGDSISWTGQAFDNEINQVKRAQYRALNNEIEKAVPGVKKDQARYGNLLEDEKAATRETARHEARNPFGLMDATLAAGGATAGAMHGSGVEGALLGVGLPLARHALQSPLVQTTGVQALKNAPKGLSPEFLRFVRNAAFGASSGANQ